MSKDKNASPNRKKDGVITSFFKPKPRPKPATPPKPRGRPRKQKASATTALAQAATTDKTEEPTTKRRFIDYSDPLTKKALDEAVDYYITHKKYMPTTDVEISNLPLVVFPKSTIHDHARIRSNELQEDAASRQPPHRLNSGGNSMFHDNNGRSLTNPVMQEFIGNTIKFRDEAQNGMPRKEVIQLVMRLTGSDKKASENHFDHLICAKKLPQLKNFGRVQSAQATTTKRACIRVEQQLRWHNTIEAVWEDHRLYNNPTSEWLQLQPKFQLNLDETCIMGSLGSLKIVGSAEVKA